MNPLVRVGWDDNHKDVSSVREVTPIHNEFDSLDDIMSDYEAIMANENKNTNMSKKNAVQSS